MYKNVIYINVYLYINEYCVMIWNTSTQRIKEKFFSNVPNIIRERVFTTEILVHILQLQNVCTCIFSSANNEQQVGVLLMFSTPTYKHDVTYTVWKLLKPHGAPRTPFSGRTHPSLSCSSFGVFYFQFFFFLFCVEIYLFFFILNILCFWYIFLTFFFFIFFI